MCEKIRKWGKSLKVIITFNTPTDAMAFEFACKKAKMPGRLMPVPVTLTEGCGIGWSSEVKDKIILEKFIEEKKLDIKLISVIHF